MDSESAVRRIYDMVLHLHQEWPKLQGEVLRIGGAQVTHEAEDDRRHREVLAKIREMRVRVVSVSDEMEDTKTRDLRELQRRASLPGRIGIWLLRVAVGAVVVAAMSIIVRTVWR